MESAGDFSSENKCTCSCGNVHSEHFYAFAHTHIPSTFHLHYTKSILAKKKKVSLQGVFFNRLENLFFWIFTYLLKYLKFITFLLFFIHMKNFYVLECFSSVKINGFVRVLSYVFISLWFHSKNLFCRKTVTIFGRWRVFRAYMSIIFQYNWKLQNIYRQKMEALRLKMNMTMWYSLNEAPL